MALKLSEIDFRGLPAKLVEDLKNTFTRRVKLDPEAPASGSLSRGLIALFVISAIVASLTLLFHVRQVQREHNFAEAAASLQIFAHQATRDAVLATYGNESAGSHLAAASKNLDEATQLMHKLQSDTLLTDSKVTKALEQLDAEWKAFAGLIKSIEPGQPDAAATTAKVDEIVAAGEKYATTAQNMIADYNAQGKAIILLGISVIAGVAALSLLVYLGYRQLTSAKRRFAEMEQANLGNQEAILHLLDEMGDLADGDLTVKAQVTENITGAIADSINYTIDSLRDLVAEINRATQQVNQATAQAQETSDSLLAAAEEQSRQIEDTGEAVTDMTRSILNVSSNAGQAAEVAQRSLQAATQGAQAVQNTISGMNEIRSQIQETSKRIKRLGESSQEISEIVELISDITEQTNILALNAAIQAASAGEAGRGFTVVAEEVQRLAERSSEATKQISAIVKTIQTDTNSAVAAMEKSTEGVVEGARLSDAAGQALNEIETVTNNLARLIQAISEATVAQTEVAAIVSRNMQQIQNITSQTTEGTKQTAESVGQLSSLSEELRESVAGFKLS